MANIHQCTSIVGLETDEPLPRRRSATCYLFFLISMCRVNPHSGPSFWKLRSSQRTKFKKIQLLQQTSLFHLLGLRCLGFPLGFPRLFVRFREVRPIWCAGPDSPGGVLVNGWRKGPSTWGLWGVETRHVLWTRHVYFDEHGLNDWWSVLNDWGSHESIASVFLNVQVVSIFKGCHRQHC